MSSPRIYRIPFTSVAQRFTIALAGREFVVTCRWNGEMIAWEIDLDDAATGASIFASLALVTGVDLFSQYKHLALGGKLVAYTDGDPTSPPTETNLGAEGGVYFLVTQ